MVVLAAAAVATLLPAVIILVFILGIPITGITVFLLQNGTLIAILVALLIVVQLFKKK